MTSLALIAGAFVLAATAADAAPYGRDFQAADLAGRLAAAPVPSCVFPDGSHVELVRKCLRPEHWFPDICAEFEVSVRHLEADGDLRRSFIVPRDPHADSIADAVTCDGEERITVAGGGCLQVQTFDGSGTPLAPPVRIEDESCDTPVAIQALDGRTFLAVSSRWSFDGSGNYRPALLAGVVDIEGKSVVPPEVVLVMNDEEYVDKVDVAAGTDGSALVVWSYYSDISSYYSDYPDDGIHARWLRLATPTEAAELGPVHRVDIDPLGARKRPRAFSLDADTFLVAWESSARGGTVARRFAPDDGTAVTTTTTSTTTTTLGVLPFEPLTAREIVAGNGEGVALHSVAGNGAATMLASYGKDSWEEDWPLYQVRTLDGGRTWTDLRRVGKGRYSTLAYASGTWLRMSSYFADGREERCIIGFARSRSDGTRWRGGALSDGDPEYSPDYNACDTLQIASDDAGRWRAAWRRFVHVECCGYDYYAVVVSQSVDDGRSWSLPQEIYVTIGDTPILGPRLAADADGNWLLLWSETGGDVTLAARAHGASDWSVAAPLFDDPGAGAAHVSAGGDGVWLAAWSARAASDELGFDADVVVARSTDGGESWSAPAPVAAFAHVDEANDLDPIVESDTAGGRLLVWKSHHDLGHRLGTDADLLASYSINGGLTWSAPAALDTSAGADRAADSLFALEAREPAAWAAVWTSVDLATGAEWTTFASSSDGCGDGAKASDELCDDGNRTSGDGCDANCTPTACGNGVVSAGEQCDDANASYRDACLPDCTRATCGDGHVNEGVEPCDDGNASASDDCLPGCVPARCGDGVVFAGVEQCDDGNLVEGDGCDTTCRITGCHSGVVTGDEECDDGNRSNEDDCVGECESAFCGDGYTRREGRGDEECDDANADNGDDCTTSCRRARCGDGFLYRGVEACDDGNRNYWDSCLGDCQLARCGDGYLNVEKEQCDDGNTDAGDACSQSCRWTGLDCADADGSGRVTATDASMVLRAGVSSLVACPMERCDVDRSGVVTAHDALLVLRVAVGLSTPEACARLLLVTFRLAGDQRLGALQLALDYTNVAGEFLGDGDDVACESAMDGEASFNDDVARRTLRFGVISTTGVQGPADVARCAFADTGGPLDLAFGLAIEDAASPDLTPLRPAIELRIEPAP